VDFDELPRIYFHSLILKTRKGKNKMENLLKDELSRRGFITGMAKSCLGVSAILGAEDLLAYEIPGKTASARHVIFLYMAGGMTHIDTFDPKPENKDVMGETTAINTSADGIQLGNWLPNTAKQMHNAALIRSLTSNQGAHQQANYLLHTSYQRRGTIKHPTLGSWVSRLSGKLNRTLPAHVRINGGSDVLGAGFLESKHGPLPLGNPSSGIQNVKAAGYLEQSLYTQRLHTAQEFNKMFLNEYSQKQVRAYTDLYNDAVKLMSSKDLEAFDLTKETEATRELYGENNFGQGCLLARRLVETGVRFVEVQLGGWDMHNGVFDGMATRGATLDQGLSALLSDLERTGKIDDTMVVVASEFGRTPEVKAGRIGRDHHPTAFSAMLAGGGIKGGTVYGKSDERAHYVEEEGSSVEDLNATIAHALGLKLEEIHYSPSGRPFKVAHDGKVLTKLLV
tara:strand:- start:156 stop:1511 length:1356 start_codon:yes stop_codon:yes gene_type:complete